MAQLRSISDKCGYTDYLEKFVTYPPAGQLPLPVATNGTFDVTDECDIFDLIFNEISVCVTTIPRSRILVDGLSAIFQTESCL